MRRYLGDEPVDACPPSRLYHLQKYARRHRAAFATGILVSFSLVLGLTVSTWQAIVATEAKALASGQLALTEKQRDAARENLYLAHMRLAHQDWAVGNFRRMLDHLEQHRPSPDQPDLRGWGMVLPPLSGPQGCDDPPRPHRLRHVRGVEP